MENRLARLGAVFQKVFENDGLSITRETTVRDVEGWDSLMLVTLFFHVERSFNVKVSSGDIARLERVGDLMDLIESQTSAH